LGLEEGRLNMVIMPLPMWKEHFRGNIFKREEGSSTHVLKLDNYKNIIPSAQSLEEAITYLKRLYGTTEGVFTAYYFKV